MRRLDLNESDALRLADVIAGKWAHRVTSLAGAECAWDNPVRSNGQSKRRAYEVEAATWASILRQLGANPLPALNATGIVGEYVSPGRGRGGETIFRRDVAQEEAKRLRDIVVEAVKAARP